MTDFVFITGNAGKVKYLKKWLDRPVAHQEINLDEIQSLDLRTVAAHKARDAYEHVGRTVLVEDIALTLTAMGRLPGPLIKWFLQDLGNNGVCTLANGLAHREAVATICYALYDGSHIEFFESSVKGHIAPKPQGDNGFGWNDIFIPDGSTKTYAEMTDEEVRSFSVRAQAIEELTRYLASR